jgi:hypothetical protein
MPLATGLHHPRSAHTRAPAVVHPHLLLLIGSAPPRPRRSQARHGRVLLGHDDTDHGSRALTVTSALAWSPAFDDPDTPVYSESPTPSTSPSTWSLQRHCLLGDCATPTTSHPCSVMPWPRYAPSTVAARRPRCFAPLVHSPPLVIPRQRSCGHHRRAVSHLQPSEHHLDHRKAFACSPSPLPTTTSHRR